MINKNALNSKHLSNLIFVLVLLCLFFSKGMYLNNDGELYISQAQEFVNGNFNVGFKIYNWPFYSLLIALFSFITFNDLLLASKLLSFIFFYGIYFFYIKIIDILSPGVNYLFALLLLLSVNKLFDSYYLMIIRDHGAWLGYIASFYFLIKYVSGNILLLKDSLKWQVCLFVSFLFRPEFIAYLFVIPFFVQYLHFKNLNIFSNTQLRLPILFKDYSLLFISFFIVIIFTFIFKDYHFRYFEIITRLLDFHDRFNDTLNISSNNSNFNILVNDYEKLLKYTFLLALTFFKIIHYFGLIYCVLIYLFFKKYISYQNIEKLFIFFISIHLLIVLFNSFLDYVITPRYSTPIIIITIPFLLISCRNIYIYLSKNRMKKYLNYMYLFSIMFFTYSFMNIFFDKNNKEVYFDCSEKLKKFAFLQINKNFVTNSSKFYYFFSGSLKKFDLKHTDFENFDYLVLEDISKLDEDLYSRLMLNYSFEECGGKKLFFLKKKLTFL